MVRVILDPAIGNKTLTFTFKRDGDFESYFDQICNEFSISKDEFVVFNSQTQLFITKIFELSLLFCNF